MEYETGYIKSQEENTFDLSQMGKITMDEEYILVDGDTVATRSGQMQNKMIYLSTRFDWKVLRIDGDLYLVPIKKSE